MRLETRVILVLATLMVAGHAWSMQDPAAGQLPSQQLARQKRQSWWNTWAGGDNVDEEKATATTTEASSTTLTKSTITTTTPATRRKTTKNRRPKTTKRPQFEEQSVITSAEAFPKVPKAAEAEPSPAPEEPSSTPRTEKSVTPAPKEPPATEATRSALPPKTARPRYDPRNQPQRTPEPPAREPLALLYINAQSRKTDKFTSELEFNQYEMAYLVLKEIPQRAQALVNELSELLGEKCRQQWPHMSHPLAQTQPCPTSRAKLYQDLGKFEEWVLSSQVFGKKLKKLKEETEKMNEQYAYVMKEALKGLVVDPADPRGFSESSIPASAPALSSPPTMFSNLEVKALQVDTDPPPQLPKLSEDHFQKVKKPEFSQDYYEGALFQNPGIQSLERQDEETVGIPVESPETAPKSPTASSEGMDSTTPQIVPEVTADVTRERELPAIPKYLYPTDGDFTDYTYGDISNSAPSHPTSNRPSIRSFFGFPDDDDLETDHQLDSINSKFLHANHSAEETRLVLRMALEDPSGTTDAFFFASNLFTLSPTLYDTVKSDIPPLVDTIIRAPKYRIELLQNRTEYRLYMNSSLRMGALRVNPVLDLLIQRQYWKFLPRYNGQYFILFNVETKSIVGVENGWDDSQLYFKNESTVSVKSFLDQNAPVMEDRFLWILLLECDKEGNRANNEVDGSEFQPCAPENLYLEVINKEFYSLRFALDAKGDIVMRSDDLRPRFDVKV